MYQCNIRNDLPAGDHKTYSYTNINLCDINSAFKQLEPVSIKFVETLPKGV